MNVLDLTRKLVVLPGPCGQEKPVRDFVLQQLRAINYDPSIDAKGNVLVRFGKPGAHPRILVTAHLDELSLMVRNVESDGRLRVTPLGGAVVWKWGEGPVEIMTEAGYLPGVLSFGSMHSNHKDSISELAKNGLTWDMSFIFTGLSAADLAAKGVRPGVRVVLSRSRRAITECGEFIGSYFLDDRAPLAVWLMALEAFKQSGYSGPGELIFAATVSEEIGGLGACYILNESPADICVALEIGPNTPDSHVTVDSQPTIWVKDIFAPMESIDGEILTRCCAELGQKPHWQYLSSAGSDASCAAKYGQVARPVTLALAVENSHGYEIMHRDAPGQLLRLLLEYLKAAPTSRVV